MELDSTQKDFCKSTAENIRLLAPAGSGKTLSLLWRCSELHARNKDKNQRFLIFTFTKVARNELRERLATESEFRDIRRIVRIDTLNSWALQYLRRNVESGLQVKSGKREQFFLINNVLRPIWVDDAKYAKTFPGMKNKYSNMIDLFDSMKNAGFRHDAKSIEEAFESHCGWLMKNGCEGYLNSDILRPIGELQLFENEKKGAEFKRFLKFWKQSCGHLWKSALLTLDDQKYWALLKLQERYSSSFFPEPNRYHHILVDEFQDISPLDLQLIKTLREVNKASLVIVGDDDQAIFEWRGSTPEFILNPEKYFDVDFESHVLEVNYRSPRNIVTHSQKLIGHNKHRVKKNVCPHSEDNAEISVKKFKTHMDSLNSVLTLARIAQQNGLRKEIGVIGRNKSQLIPLQILLTSEDIRYFAKQDLNVLLSYAFNDLKEVLTVVASPDRRDFAKEVVNSFLKVSKKVPLFEPNKTEQKELFKYLIQLRPTTFHHALDMFADYPGSFGGKSDKKSKLAAFEAISSVLESRTVSGALEEIGDHMNGFKRHFAKKEDDIFYKDPPFMYLADYAMRYGDDFFGFIDHLEGAVAAMQTTAEYETDDIDDDYRAPIHLMTAQSSKGKEFNTVIILDAVEGIFPSKHAETDQGLEQERRVFYVSVTRARKTLFIYTVASILDRPVSVSRYVSEMGL